jgi:hypothetical protein
LGQQILKGIEAIHDVVSWLHQILNYMSWYHVLQIEK